MPLADELTSWSQVSHADATFPFGGVTYKLQYFTTHTVSEHTVDGEHYDMVQICFMASNLA